MLLLTKTCVSVEMRHALPAFRSGRDSSHGASLFLHARIPSCLESGVAVPLMRDTPLARGGTQVAAVPEFRNPSESQSLGTPCTHAGIRGLTSS